MQDLSLAMKLRSDIVEDDPMSESNKENIIISKTPLSHGSFAGESNEPTATTTSTCNPSSEDSLVMKEPALVHATSDSQ